MLNDEYESNLLDRNQTDTPYRYVIDTAEQQDAHQSQSRLLIYRDQLRSLASELSLAEERTRRRIAKDVHDHIGQNLALAKMKLQHLAEITTEPENKMLAKEISDIISGIIESTRSLTFEISPPVLYELGLEASIKWLLKKVHNEHGLETDYYFDIEQKSLDENMSVFLFQAVRELLNNVAKHAYAKSVKISICNLENKVQVCVSDDGKGFKKVKKDSCGKKSLTFGLFSIRERLSCIDGNMRIESELSKGTKVFITVPLNV